MHLSLVTNWAMSAYVKDSQALLQWFFSILIAINYCVTLVDITVQYWQFSEVLDLQLHPLSPLQWLVDILFSLFHYFTTPIPSSILSSSQFPFPYLSFHLFHCWQWELDHFPHLFQLLTKFRSFKMERNSCCVIK